MKPAQLAIFLQIISLLFCIFFSKLNESVHGFQIHTVITGLQQESQTQVMGMYWCTTELSQV